MDRHIDRYLSRCLMLDRLKHKLADTEFQIRLEKEADASINNNRLATLNVIAGVLQREIDKIEEEREEELTSLYLFVIE